MGNRSLTDLKLSKIPFDSFTLQTVVAEAQAFTGGKVQDLRQPNDHDLSIAIYANGREAMFMISCHPEFSRAHFVTKRLTNQERPPVFLATLRSRIEGGRLVFIRQIYGDRVLELGFETETGDYRLVAELMGKHSNAVLLDSQHRILTALKWINNQKSIRPIQPNSRYELPPVMVPGQELRRSPFLIRLLEKTESETVNEIKPVLSVGYGAYPISVSALGYVEHERSSISVALEQHFALAIPKAAAESLRNSLLSQLNRTLLSREVAIHELRQAEEAGGKAAAWQTMGELILAYGASIPAGSVELEAWNYEGNLVRIELDSELDFKGNAARYFTKAKKAKSRMGMVLEQIERLSKERLDLISMLGLVANEESFKKLEEFHATAVKNRWINLQVVQSAHKEDRPYEGHRIRETRAPGGYAVLYGENAESNDYLTLRVAKPNDLWLHVRGATSAHVVIQTMNHPERVQPETLKFAAKVAVLHSSNKHSQYVPVDYTLKKYVRRPKGAAKGSVSYTNEKTLHIEM